MWQKVAFFFATTFCITSWQKTGAGTWASTIVCLGQMVAFWLGVSTGWMWWAVALSFALGMCVVESAEAYMYEIWGIRERHTGERADRDYKQTTIDEVHGQLLAGLPVFYFSELTIQGAVIFLAISCTFFRILDIYKPWPVTLAESKSISSALSIMLDDTAAGSIAAVITLILVYIV